MLLQVPVLPVENTAAHPPDGRNLRRKVRKALSKTFKVGGCAPRLFHPRHPPDACLASRFLQPFGGPCFLLPLPRHIRSSVRDEKIPQRVTENLGRCGRCFHRFDVERTVVLTVYRRVSVALLRLFDLQTQHTACPIVPTMIVDIVVAGDVKSVVHQESPAESLALEG